MTRLLEALVRIRTDLMELGQTWALVGGLAVSVRSEPRTTRDIDLVVAVENDRDAEKLIWQLKVRGYSILAHLEQDHVDPADLQVARESLLLISQRGFDRQKDLLTDFSKLLSGRG